MEINATTMKVSRELNIFSKELPSQTQYLSYKAFLEKATPQQRSMMKYKLVAKKVKQFEDTYKTIAYVPSEEEMDELIAEEEAKKKEAAEEIARRREKVQVIRDTLEAKKLRQTAITILTSQKEEKLSRQQEAIKALSEPSAISVPRVRKLFLSMRAGESDDPVSGGIDETSVAKDIGQIVAEHRRKQEQKRRYIVAMKIVGKR